MEQYEFEGTIYNVAPNRLEEFKSKFPEAKLVEESLEKPTTPQTVDAPAESDVTASKPEDGSSELQKQISGFDKAGFVYQPIGEEKAKDEKSLATGLVQSIASLRNPVQREVAKYYMKNRLDNIEENLKTAAYSVVAGVTDLVTADLDGLGYNEKQQKVREEAEEVMKSSDDKLEDLQLQMKDTGKGIVGGIRSGQGADLIAGVFGAGISMAETVVPAYLTFGVSLPLQVAGPMYTEYNKSKAKRLYGDDPKAIDKLIENDETEITTPLVLGALATGLEYSGFKGVTKYIANSGLKGKNIAKLMYTSSGEGFTEVGQLGAEVLNERLGAGDSIEDASRKSLDTMFSDEGLEMWLNGFLGASQMSVTGRALNRAVRSDKASIKEIDDKVTNLAKLNLAKNTTANKTAKQAIDVEIKSAEQDLKDYITEKRKIKDILNEDQKSSLIDIIGQQDNLRKQAEDLKLQNENGEINNKDFGYAIRAINNQNKKLIEQIETINAEAKQTAVEQQVETVQKQVEELAKIGVKGKVTRLTAEEISNVQEENFDAEAASKQFGFIKQFGDGSFEIVLNEDKPAVGTAAHEFLHAVLFKSIGADTNIQDNLGDALVEHVSKLGGDKSALAERLSKYGTFNKKGEFIRDANFGEETITIMSESIIDGSLKFDEGFFTKIGDFVRRFLQDKGLVGIKFDTGKDVFNFVKDYSKSISEGKVSKAILNVAKKGVKGKLVEGKEDAKPTTQFSKIYQEVEAMKADLINPSTKQGTAFIAADTLSNEVDRRLPRIEGITAEERADIVRNFVLDDNRGLVGLLNNYNPDRNDSIMGYLNSSTPGGKLLDARLQEFYKDDPRFGQIFQTTTDEAVATKVERETAIEEDTADLSETGRKTKGVVIGKVLNISKKASEIIKPKYEQHRSSIVNLANTPMLLTELVSEISGIPVKKLKTQANLNQHLAPAQMAAAKNAQLLLQMLPKQHTTKRVKVGKDKDGDPIYEVRPDKSTKVPQKVLDFFYNKGVRKDNLTPYTLKRNLSEKDIIEFAGVVDGKRSKDENRYYQQNLLGLWRLFDRVFSNQELRIEGEKRGETPTALQTLREGNRQILFSKAVRDLSVDKQSILFEKISEVGAGINPAYVNVKNTKDVVRSLKEIYGEDLSTQEINKIAKELGRLADVYEPVISNNKVIPEKTWTEFVAESFDQAADNIIESLKLTIDNSTPTAASLYDNIELVARARRSVIELGNNLIEKGRSPEDVARIMAVLKPMYSSSAKIGRGKISVDKNGNLFVVEGEDFGSPRGQVFMNVKDFEDNAVLKISGITPEIWNATNKKLLAQKSKDAVKNPNYNERLSEAKEAREAIDLMMNFFNESEFHNDLDIAMFMISNLSNMGAPLRRAANLQYIADAVLKINVNDLGRLAEYEHLIPANYMAIKIIQEYKSGKKVDVDNLYKNYKVAVIPKTMDDVIKKQGLQSKMHAGYDFENDPSTDRYYNFLTRGFKNIVPIRDISNNQVIGLSFSKAELDQNTNDRNISYNISKNISNVRPVLQYSKESRGMSTFDFDDTLAFTKSGIRLTRPNNTGKPQPGRKAILLVGAAGAGKTTVIDQLGLRKQGFKYVNQDVALDWLSKNSGLPQNMNDFTREQSEKWRDLQYEAASTAKDKAAKLRGKGDGVIIDSTGGNIREISRDFKDAGYDVQVIFVNSSLETALARNKARTERRLTDTTVRNSYEKVQKSLKGIKELVNFFPYSVKEFVEVNTNNIKQGEALPTNFVEKINDFTTGYIKERINAEEFAAKGADLLAEGAEFDFSEFSKVVDGTPGPLLQKMKNQVEKYGPKNVYVLTARPANSAEPIHQFLKSEGINIPLENITGLGNSTGDAKAAWMLQKYQEGYNDMYFVDDALQNVEAVQHVFDQLDVKGKSVQARIQFSKDLDSEFNKMIERKKGIAAEKEFSRVVGQKRGKNIGRYRFFVPPSANDFAGLLYDFYGKGKQGDADIEFMKKALLDPFARADREMSQARMSILEDYKMLRKELPDIKKKLGKLIDKESGFTFDNAVRVYLSNKAGFEVPGISKRDLAFLNNTINTDQDLKTFADTLSIISKRKEGWIELSENWSVESVASDLENIVSKIGRKQYLSEFVENKNIIFSTKNLNKIEAIYGSRFRQALEDSLYRMENGTNRSAGRSYGQAWTNWVNGSVGAIMFFNARSAVLQTLSTVNFINFQDNNIFKAGKAFANQKQYWSDFTTLFNSDFLKARRAGLQINVNEAELANAVAGAQNKAKAALAYLLKKGFLPTQFADSFAIASGGSTFYRNRIKTYVKQGIDQKAAEEKAFLDFQEIAQETQQSSRPDRISQQQASPLGRLILAFANTPMQYNRLIKKAYLDLANNRGDWRSNVSRILYYGAIQNVIFSSLQSAIFALSFDDEEDDELDNRAKRVLNGTIDTLLRGSGVAGAAVATAKNVILRFISESERKSRADYGQVVVEALQVSPPMGSKARKTYSALNAYKFNREIMGSMDTFDYNNPIWDAAANVTTAATNVPLDRLFRKADNIKEAFNQENSNMQRAMLLLGWSTWDLQVGERIVVNKGKPNQYVRYLDSKRQAQQEAKEELKQEKKEAKKSKRCTAISRNTGRRCQNTTTNKSGRCYVHN